MVLSPEQSLTVIRKGDYLGKYGRAGGMKIRWFAISTDGRFLEWSGRAGARRIDLKCVTNITPGRGSALFRAKDGELCRTNPAKYHEINSVSFSMHYQAGRGKSTLDLQCVGNEEESRSATEQFKLWFNGLNKMVEVARANAAHFAREKAHREMDGMSVEVSEDWMHTHSTTPSPGMSRMSKQMSASIPEDSNLSTMEHSPAAYDIPAEPDLSGMLGTGKHTDPRHSSPITASSPHWGHAVTALVNGGPVVVGDVLYCGKGAVPKDSPLMDVQGTALLTELPASSQLDAAQAAACEHGVVVVTRAGDAYTWGETADGHFLSTPTKVQGVAGQRCVRAACAQAAMFLLTDKGTLYSWGKSATGVLGQSDQTALFTPRQIRSFWMDGTLRPDLRVHRIAAGIQHCAAIVEDGKLFTWGDGVHGRLGHGDMEAAHEPRLVKGLEGQRVTSVSCGHYHTAAVCLDSPLDALADTHSSVPDSDVGGSDSLFGRPRGFSPMLSTRSGQLFTWGGVFTSQTGGTAFTSSHDGCLGHPHLQKHEGELQPKAVELPFVQDVACGLNFTLALDMYGAVHQMGSMLRNGPVAGAEWEGAKVPTRVGGPLANATVTRVVAGRAHAAVCARPAHSGNGSMSARNGVVQAPPPLSVLTWGSNEYGQLGRVTARVTDSANGAGRLPSMGSLGPMGSLGAAGSLLSRASGPVQPVSGRGAGSAALLSCLTPGIVERTEQRTIISVAAGAATTLAVLQHVKREGNGSRPTSATSRGQGSAGSLRPASRSRSQTANGTARGPMSLRVLTPSPSRPGRILSLSMDNSSADSTPKSAQGKGGGPKVPVSDHVALLNTVMTQQDRPRDRSMSREPGKPYASTHAFGPRSERSSTAPHSDRSLHSSASSRSNAAFAGAAGSPFAPHRPGNSVARMHNLLSITPPGDSTTTAVQVRMEARIEALERALMGGNGTADTTARMDATAGARGPGDPQPVVAGSRMQAVPRPVSEPMQGSMAALQRTAQLASQPNFAPPDLEPARQAAPQASQPAAEPAQGGRAGGNTAGSSPTAAAHSPLNSEVESSFHATNAASASAAGASGDLGYQDAMALRNEVMKLRSQLAEEREQRKKSETRTMELRLRLSELQGAQEQGREKGDVRSMDEMRLYRSLVEHNPTIVDSFWVPIDRGVHARIDVAEHAVLAKLKFSSRLFDKDAVKEWYRTNKHHVAVGKLLVNPASNSSDVRPPEAAPQSRNGQAGAESPAPAPAPGSAGVHVPRIGPTSLGSNPVLVTPASSHFPAAAHAATARDGFPEQSHAQPRSLHAPIHVRPHDAAAAQRVAPGDGLDRMRGANGVAKGEVEAHQRRVRPRQQQRPTSTGTASDSEHSTTGGLRTRSSRLMPLVPGQAHHRQTISELPEHVVPVGSDASHARLHGRARGDARLHAHSAALMSGERSPATVNHAGGGGRRPLLLAPAATNVDQVTSMGGLGGVPKA